MAKITHKDDLVIYIVKELTRIENKTRPMHVEEQDMSTSTPEETEEKVTAVKKRHLIIDKLQGKLMAANYKLHRLAKKDEADKAKKYQNKIKYSDNEYELFNEQITFFCNRLRNGRTLIETSTRDSLLLNINQVLPKQQEFQISLTAAFIAAIQNNEDNEILSTFGASECSIDYDGIPPLPNEYDQYKDWAQKTMGQKILSGLWNIIKFTPLIYPCYRYVKEIKRGWNSGISGFIAAILECVAGAVGSFFGGHFAATLAGVALGSAIIPIPIFGAIVGGFLAAGIMAFGFKQLRRAINYFMHGTSSPQYHIDLPIQENATYTTGPDDSAKILAFLLREIKKDPETSPACKADCKAAIGILKNLKPKKDERAPEQTIQLPLSDKGITFIRDATMGGHLLTFKEKAANYRPFAQEEIDSSNNTKPTCLQVSNNTLTLGG